MEEHILATLWVYLLTACRRRVHPPKLPALMFSRESRLLLQLVNLEMTWLDLLSRWFVTVTRFPPTNCPISFFFPTLSSVAIKTLVSVPAGATETTVSLSAQVFSAFGGITLKRGPLVILPLTSAVMSPWKHLVRLCRVLNFLVALGSILTRLALIGIMVTTIPPLLMLPISLP